ncbi:MAG TPA: hypothetical protein ENI86_01985, partial [Acidimicrobiales bacterium]|nr:hypothetical protein [Acidimicrobiales bacterium]
MSLIDLNELPQPIYPDQVAPTTPEPTETPAPTHTNTHTVENVAEQVTEKVTTTVNEIRDRVGGGDLNSLVRNTKVRIALAVIGVLAVISGISNMAGGAATVSQSGSNGAAPATAGASTPVAAAGSDTDLAGALDEILFAYTTPANSTFQCMASTMGGAGYTATDVRNLAVDASTLSNAIAGCASADELLTETSGLISDLYGPGYTSDCLAGTFATFGGTEWQQWLS